MICWQRLFGLAWASLCATAVAVQAQGLPPGLGEPVEVPPPPALDEELLTLPQRDSEEAIDELSQFPTPDEFGEDSYELWDHEAVYAESTGTWLRRGFWFAKAEAVILNYTWNRDDLTILSEGGVLPSPVANTNRFQILKGSHPGYDAGVRLTLGRFLFRDIHNRDHFAEFIAYGGGNWVQEPTVASLVPANLDVPFNLSANNVAFGGASSSTANFSSRFSSFEGNYTVRSRMGRDQMVMDPDGNWVRRAWPTVTRDFLAGLRFFDLTEILDWQAEDITNPQQGIINEDGTYLIRTDNNLFGFQMGVGFNYETPRWNLGLYGKAGVMLNNTKGRQQLVLPTTDPDEDDFSYYRQAGEDQLSGLFEAGFAVRYHIRPDLSVKAGYELLHLTSLALANHQINFTPDYSTLATAGDPFYQGFSFGIEGYW